MSVLPTTNLVCPDVNFILREPFEQYLAKAREYLTSHGLGDFRKCPALHRKKKLGLIADEDRPAYLIGRAVHTLVLEGRDQFEAEYAVGGPINPKTGEVFGPTTKAFGEWAAAQGKSVLTVAQFDLVENMADGVRQSGAARDLLSEGIAEGVVRHDYRGVPAQIRMDWFDAHRGIADLKTCDDLGWFEADARRYGYSPRLNKHAGALISEWCDAVLFATRKIVTRTEVGAFNRSRTKATAVGKDGGERILRCIGGPSCIAKNRYDLPTELPLDWDALAAGLFHQPNTDNLTQPQVQGV